MPTTVGTAVQCSFCRKSQHEVRKVIAGPGVYICNECIALCDDILEAELPAELPNYDEWNDDDLLAQVVTIHESHAQIDAAVARLIRHLRDHGVTWARIGEALGMTRQSAWERFSGEE